MDLELSNLRGTAVDCQTTGAVPEKGWLLEMGWAPHPSHNQQAVSHLVRLPENQGIPRRVRRLTGISEKDLETALAPEAVWKAFVHDAKKSARKQEPPILLIHYARFELPFLKKLASFSEDEPGFDFQVICTHEISRRLLPHLPRKGLRALAGHLGLHVSQMRRSGPHALATCFIWRKLIRLLAETQNIDTFGGLEKWLRLPFRPQKSRRFFLLPKNIRLSLPDTPGVYTFLGAQNRPLYVGKAKSLKKRVNSHFKKTGKLSENILEMLTRAWNVRVYQTQTALEAALLESDEILRLSPPCNVALKPEIRSMGFMNGRMEMGQEFQPGGWGPFPFDEKPVWLSLAAKVLAPDNGPALDLIQLKLHTEAFEANDWIQGIEIFKNQWINSAEGRNAGGKLLWIGKAVWREKEEQKSPPDEDKPTDPPCIQIARRLNHTALQWCVFNKKAAWYALLSQSSLAWKTSGCNPGCKSDRLLIFSRAQILAADRIGASLQPPPPPKADRAMGRRRAGLDRAAWQRMAVLTAELRRLASEDRPMALRTARGRSFTARCLKSILAGF